MMLR
jgi:MFS family permease